MAKCKTNRAKWIQRRMEQKIKLIQSEKIEKKAKEQELQEEHKKVDALLKECAKKAELMFNPHVPLELQIERMLRR